MQCLVVIKSVTVALMNNLVFLKQFHAVWLILSEFSLIFLCYLRQPQSLNPHRGDF